MHLGIYRPTPAATRKRLIGMLWLGGYFLLLAGGGGFLMDLLTPHPFMKYFIWFVFSFGFLAESVGALLMTCKEIRWEADKLVIVRWHRVHEVRWDELKAIWTNKDKLKYRAALGLVHGKGAWGHRVTDIPRDYEIADAILEYAESHSIPIALHKGRTLGMKS